MREHWTVAWKKLTYVCLCSTLKMKVTVGNGRWPEFKSSIILRTGAVVELRRSQGWRTDEHIGCHQSLGTWVWRSKMSRASLVRAEWPVEFKWDFNIITRELSRAAQLFSLVIIEPSNWSIKSLYKETR